MRASFDPEIAPFVERFNAGDYEESLPHLIQLWQSSSGSFYKGLIQLAGALQHWQGGHAFWAEDLLATAHNLLQPFAPVHMGVDVGRLLRAIQECHAVAKETKETGARPDEVTMPAVTLHPAG